MLHLQRLVLPQSEEFHMMNSKEKERQRSQLSGLAEKKMLKQLRTKKEQDRLKIKRNKEMPEMLK